MTRETPYGSTPDRVRHVLAAARRRLLPRRSRRGEWAERWLFEPLRLLLTREVHSRFGASPPEAPGDPNRPAVLFVLHRTTGGIPLNTSDLAAGLCSGWRPFVLEAQLSAFRLYRFDERAGTWHALRTFHFHSVWSPDWRRDDERRDAYRRAIATVGASVVHVRHFLGQTPDLVDVCEEAGVPTVFSFHDYYTACPSIHLLDRSVRYCAGRCPTDASHCSVSDTYWLQGLDVFGADGLDGWRERSGRELERFGGFVVPSQSAAEILIEAFPFLADGRLEVIEHGRDFPSTRRLATPPEPGGPIRILVPGNLAVHKGSELLRRLLEVDRERGRRIELHLAGESRPALAGLGEYHGSYNRESLGDLVERLRPSFIGVFSIWPEIYCHVVTEAWSNGIPLFVTDLGAQGERLRRHGGGWLVPADDVEEIHRRILAAADDTEGYLAEVERATIAGVPTRREMARGYSDLYRRATKRAGRATDEQAPSRPIAIER